MKAALAEQDLVLDEHSSYTNLKNIKEVNLMNKGKLVVFLLVWMLLGTVVFAETVSVRVGTGYLALKCLDTPTSDTYTGYELTGRVWFSQMPQLTVNVSYQNLRNEWNDDHYGDFDDLAITGEYRIFNKTNYGFSVKAGWLNKGFIYTDDDERIAGNFLTIGGKGNLVLTRGLQAIVDVAYAKNLVKAEDDPEATIVAAKIGAEFNLAKVPGLKLGAYYLFDRTNSEEYYVEYLDYAEDKRTGLNFAVSYGMSF